MTHANNLQCLWDGKAVLGEGPVYSARKNGLFWVDIKGCCIHWMNLAGQSVTVWDMPEPVGWALERQQGGLICGLKSGISIFDTDTATLTKLIDPEPDQPGNRLNDAKVDPFGRLWFGSMDNAETSQTGSLYSLTKDLTCRKMDSGYVVSNGPAFSPDGRTLYHTSSAAREIFAFDLQADGQLQGKRRFIKFGENDGYPDGMTTDSAGGLWVAHWDGWRISRFHPDGSLDCSIEMPVQRPTSLCFGGKDLDQLYITSASINLTSEALELQPLAGGLFRLKTAHRGLPQTLFAG